MAEPTSALSFHDLILEVAKESGMAYYGSSGEEQAMIPVDPQDFEDCKRIVNNGIMAFIAAAPIKGWRWMRRILPVTLTATRITGTVDSASSTTIVDATLTASYDTNDDLKDYWCYILTGTGAGSYAQITGYTTATGTVTVADWLSATGAAAGTDPVADDTFVITPVETVGGDITRYPLPEYFGGTPDGPIEYERDSTHGTQIEWVDESRVRARQAINTLIDYPRFASIRRLEYTSGGYGPKRRFELFIDKKPSASEVVEFPFTLFFDKLKMLAGLASGGSGTTLVDASFANYYPDDYFNATWKCFVTSGTGRNARGTITDFTGSTFTVTVADWLGIDDSTASAADPTANSAYYMEPLYNLHPAGFPFDESIKAACLAQAELEVEDVTAGFMDKYVKFDLQNAYKIDQRSAPRKLGSGNLPRVYGRRGGRSNVTTDNDI